MNDICNSTMSRDYHGFWKPAGKCPGLSGVGVRVGNFYPSENPYPSHGLAGLIRIQTPLENATNASQCCQLASLTHSEMGIHV